MDRISGCIGTPYVRSGLQSLPDEYTDDIGCTNTWLSSALGGSRFHLISKVSMALRYRFRKCWILSLHKCALVVEARFNALCPLAPIAQNSHVVPSCTR